MRGKLALIAVVVGALVPIVGAGTPVQAAPSAAVRQQMSDQLRLAPGGVRTGPTQITYGGGRFVVDFAASTGVALAAADCPRYWVCFYDGTNYGYPRGRLQDCGQQDLATWGWRNRINSAHDNQGASADFWDVENDYDGFWVDYPGRVPDVGTAKNKVDLIYINCG
jgi:hypothetical protein